MNDLKTAMRLALVVILLASLLFGFKFAVYKINDYQDAATYDTLSKENGALNLPVVGRHISYSGLYGLSHYCLEIDTGNGIDEVEVSSRTYKQYTVGSKVSCVMDGTRIVINPST